MHKLAVTIGCQTGRPDLRETPFHVYRPLAVEDAVLQTTAVTPREDGKQYL